MCQVFEHVLHISEWVFYEYFEFPPTFQKTKKYASKWVGYVKLPLVVNECVNLCLLGAGHDPGVVLQIHHMN